MREAGPVHAHQDVRVRYDAQLQEEVRRVLELRLGGGGCEEGLII